MDPKLFSLPKITLDDGEEPCDFLSFSNVSPHYCQMFPADRSASPEEQAVCQPGPSLHMNHGPFYPSEPRLVMDEVPASLSTSTAPEIHWSVANAGQITDTLSVTLKDPNQHLDPSLNLIQPQIQAVQGCSAPLQLQPVLTPTCPGLLFSPCSLLDSSWVNMRSGFGFSSFLSVPISGPAEILYGHRLPPGSLLLQAEVQPSWCLCPQAVQVHQPCSPHLFSRGAAQQAAEQFGVVPQSAGEEQSGEQTEEEQQNNITEEWLGGRSFEENMTAMDSLRPQIQDCVQANEDEKLEAGNPTLLQYLDDLCNSDDLIQEVEQRLNMEYLDSLLSSDGDTIDLLASEEQDQEVDPAFSSQPDPIDFLPLKEIKQEPLEEILQESLALSADFSSDPVTEEASPTTSGAEAPLQGAQPQFDSHRFLDELTAAQSVSESPTSEPAATVLESEEASASLSNSADTPSTDPPPGDPPASDGPSATSVSEPALAFSPPALSVLAQKTLSAQIRQPEEQRSLENTNTNPSCVEDPALASSSFMVDSSAEPCDPVVDGDLGTMTALVPEKQTGVSSEIRAEERREKGEINPLTTVTQEQREERMITKTLERKEEEEEEEDKTKVIGRTNVRRSQTQSDQTEEETRLSSKSTTEERKADTFTPERDGGIHEKQERRSSAERQLCKTEENYFEEPSQDKAHTENSAEFSETAGKEEQRILVVGMQREGHADDCESGAENLFKHPQEEKEGKVAMEEEGIEMSTSVRTTTSTASEGKVPAAPPLPARHSPERDAQSITQQEKAAEPHTLLLSSPMKRRSRERDEEERSNKDKVSRICSPVTTPESPLKAQTDARSAGEEITEAPSVKTCEESPDLAAAVCAGAQKLSTSAASGPGGGCRRAGEARQHAATETQRSYSLRSLKRAVSKTRSQENMEEMHQQSNPEQSPEQTAGVEREDGGINEEAGCPGLTSSPKKRYRHGRRASAEREVSRAEERDGGQRLALNEKVETSDCEPSMTQNKTTEREKASNSSAGRETLGGDRMSATETGASRQGSCKRRFKKFPPQQRDFMLSRAKTRRGRAGRGRTLRSGKIFGK